MISIVLPTFNSLKFLCDRVETILNQTLTNWECIVVDGQSKDGTWEYLEKVAKIDSRFQLYQFPPKGPYDAWNKGIKRAKGRYVYIATSDDTMNHDCLEKMSKALDENLNCGIAHCNLTLINESGEPTEDQWKNWAIPRFLDDALNESHVRKRPHDAVLYMNYKTAYTSITQLLIRKEVYENFGDFRTDFGNIADFEWGLRVTQCTDTIHIPEYLATWRQHSNQLSESNYFTTGNYFDALLNMVLACNQTLEKFKVRNICSINPDLYLMYLRATLKKGTVIQKLKWLIKMPFLSAKIGYQYLFKNTLSSEDFTVEQMNKMQLSQNLIRP